MKNLSTNQKILGKFQTNSTALEMGFDRRRVKPLSLRWRDQLMVRSFLKMERSRRERKESTVERERERRTANKQWIFIVWREQFPR